MNQLNIDTNFIWIQTKTVVTQARAAGLLMRELLGLPILKIRKAETDTPKFPAAMYHITMYSHQELLMVGVGRPNLYESRYNLLLPGARYCDLTPYHI